MNRFLKPSAKTEPAAAAERTAEPRAAVAIFVSGERTSFAGRKVYGSGYGDTFKFKNGSIEILVSGQYSGRDDHIVKRAIRERLDIHLFYRQTATVIKNTGKVGGVPFIYCGRASSAASVGGRFEIKIASAKNVKCGHYMGSFMHGGIRAIGGEAKTNRFNSCFYEITI
jgi:hypothetical protein